MGKFYYTYVLKSYVDKNIYIGWTDDLVNRVNQHNRGPVKSTNKRKPLSLIYYEACLSKICAIKREKALKTGFGRSYLQRRIKN